ncbi:rho guanine nucleotide exchange factor 18 [Sphaerodactylus townsendi]|uniref:rho guanine nucleotide exchange factor 18 n=1 Tax=Sphaerodactylus townsendi TaxID=933632 RepID=UPI0020275E08|nr:rho guanine nucleotide exchange factor 18 [Sphaerodactylus townsendi]
MSQKISNSSIVRRLGIQECNLLVTQRIMKYPVLVERIIQNTEAGTEDWESLTQALQLIKEAITAIDTKVNECEKAQRLRELVARMEFKSSWKFQNGLVFRKEDMLQRRLLSDGMLSWKAASGRLKEVLAVLLTDVLLLLQEKDQKCTFASVDSKSPVISLQKLIVREVANEEKAMFLISASLEGPEMYEIHTSSKEDRNFWMALIRRAVENCPDEEERIPADPEEERKQAEARAAKLKEFHDRLRVKDDLIVQSLNEKQQIYLEMAEMSGFKAAPQASRPWLLCRTEVSEDLHGEALVKQAVTEVESIQHLIFTQLGSAACRPEDGCASGALRRAETFGGYDRATAGPAKTGSFKKKVCGGDPWVRERRGLQANPDVPAQELPSAINEGPCLSDLSRLECSGRPQPAMESELVQRIQALLRLLLSLQVSYGLPQVVYGIAGCLWYCSIQILRERTAGCWCGGKPWFVGPGKPRKEKKPIGTGCVEGFLCYQVELCSVRASVVYSRGTERSSPSREGQCCALVALNSPLIRSSGGHLPAHPVTLNGEGLQGSPGPLAKPCGRAGGSGLDCLERTELARRDSAMAEGRPVLLLKNEVPVHLLSATNQSQKQAAVQQQIPTKLATFTKGSKGTKPGKASQRTDSSASVDLRQLFNPRLAGKDESGSRSRQSSSPVFPHSQNAAFLPADLPGSAESRPEALLPPAHLFKPNVVHSLPPAQDDATKEDIIYF